MNLKQLVISTNRSTFLLVIMELLRRGTSIEEIHEKTGIDLFFLHVLN